MSNTKVVIIVVVVVAITAEALNSLKEVVGDVGSAGDESVPGGPLPHRESDMLCPDSHHSLWGVCSFGVNCPEARG